MGKYNIYRIKKGAKEELVEKLTSVGLDVISEIESDGFSLQFFFSKEPDLDKLVFEQGEKLATRKASQEFFAWMMKQTAFFWAGAGDLSPAQTIRSRHGRMVSDKEDSI